MSSIYAQKSNGPFILSYAAELSQEPFLVASGMYALLDMDVTKRPEHYAFLVREKLEKFEALRAFVKSTIVGQSWKYTGWDREQKIFYNLKCERCTLDEAVCDYLLSLPAALRADIAAPGLTEADIKAARDAYLDIKERARAITG